jgi:hypothetical protein
MQKMFFYTFILALILAPIDQTFASSDDCFSLMRKVLKKTRNQQIQSGSIEDSLTIIVKTKILKIAKESGLTELEALVLLEKVPNKKIDLKKLRSYTNYLTTLKNKQKNRGIEELADLFLFPENKRKSQIVKDFEKLQIFINKKYSNQLRIDLKKLIKKNPEESLTKLRKLAKKSSKEFRTKYEKLTYGCRANKATPEKKTASRLFKRFVMSIGVASSIGGYTYANYDRDFNSQWFGKLGYELSIGMVSNYLGARVLTNPNNTVVRMGLQRYLLARSFGVVDMGLYSTFFSGNQDAAEQRLEQLRSSDNIREEISDLSAYLKDEKTLVKYKRMLIENIKSLLRNNEIAPEENYKIDYSSFDFTNLRAEDLDNLEVQEMIIAAILAQEYEENRGDIIATGDVGADRFSFHAAYGLVMMPKDIATNLYIYKVLCMGQINPRAALMKAVGLYTLNRVVFDQLYYFMRRTSINQ